MPPLNLVIRRIVKFSTSIWDDPIEIDEVEVHYSRDGRGRASIVRRPDGLLCIYKHWKASAELYQRLTGTDATFSLWWDDKTPLEELYRDSGSPSGKNAVLRFALPSLT